MGTDGTCEGRWFGLCRPELQEEPSLLRDLLPVTHQEEQHTLNTCSTDLEPWSDPLPPLLPPSWGGGADRRTQTDEALLNCSEEKTTKNG